MIFHFVCFTSAINSRAGILSSYNYLESEVCNSLIVFSCCLSYLFFYYFISLLTFSHLFFARPFLIIYWCSLLSKAVWLPICCLFLIIFVYVFIISDESVVGSWCIMLTCSIFFLIPIRYSFMNKVFIWIFIAT